jgi:hypothetical protein
VRRPDTTFRRLTLAGRMASLPPIFRHQPPKVRLASSMWTIGPLLTLLFHCHGAQCSTIVKATVPISLSHRLANALGASMWSPVCSRCGCHGAVIGSVLVALLFAPRTASASCGDYVSVLASRPSEMASSSIDMPVRQASLTLTGVISTSLPIRKLQVAVVFPHILHFIVDSLRQQIVVGAFRTGLTSVRQGISTLPDSHTAMRYL